MSEGLDGGCSGGVLRSMRKIWEETLGGWEAKNRQPQEALLGTHIEVEGVAMQKAQGVQWNSWGKETDAHAFNKEALQACMQSRSGRSAGLRARPLGVGTAAGAALLSSRDIWRLANASSSCRHCWHC